MNSILKKTNRGLWYSSVITTGILAGFLISHSIMLGRFFSWTFSSGNGSFFKDLFSVFRAASRANVHYNLFLWLNLLSGILWLISCIIVKKNRILALTAGMSSLWVGFAFFSTGFAKAENAVASAIADQTLTDLYVKLNLPLHRSFAVFYLVCFAFLLIIGNRVYGKSVHPE